MEAANETTLFWNLMPDEEAMTAKSGRLNVEHPEHKVLTKLTLEHPPQCVLDNLPWCRV